VVWPRALEGSLAFRLLNHYLPESVKNIFQSVAWLFWALADVEHFDFNESLPPDQNASRRALLPARLIVLSSDASEKGRDA
jgi:hypothetical protein